MSCACQCPNYMTSQGFKNRPPLVHALFQREPICTPFLASYSAIPKPCESQLTPTSSVILSDHLTILEFSRRQTRGSVSLWLVLSWIPSSHPQVATWASLWLDESFPASVHGRIQAPRASAWGPVDVPDTPVEAWKVERKSSVRDMCIQYVYTHK